MYLVSTHLFLWSFDPSSFSRCFLFVCEFVNVLICTTGALLSCTTLVSLRHFMGLLIIIHYTRKNQTYLSTDGSKRCRVYSIQCLKENSAVTLSDCLYRLNNAKLLPCKLLYRSTATPCCKASTFM